MNIELNKKKTEENNMKKETTGNENGNVILTYTVAECGEFHSLGEYHEGIQTIDEAERLYRQIPPARRLGIPSIGINLHTIGTDSIGDTQMDVLTGNEIDIGIIRLMPGAYENRQVMEAVEAVIERFPEKEVVDY